MEGVKKLSFAEVVKNGEGAGIQVGQKGSEKETGQVDFEIQSGSKAHQEKSLNSGDGGRLGCV